uniref:Uncharacterized protein n=1 Tax=Setaria digitata TaxID=48799 RepID=A0A915Q6B1_9BILA
MYMESFGKVEDAWMNLGGPGYRLQTCSRLATEWFDSTFWVYLVADDSCSDAGFLCWGHPRTLATVSCCGERGRKVTSRSSIKHPIRLIENNMCFTFAGVQLNASNTAPVRHFPPDDVPFHENC